MNEKTPKNCDTKCAGRCMIAPYHTWLVLVRAGVKLIFMESLISDMPSPAAWPPFPPLTPCWYVLRIKRRRGGWTRWCWLAWRCTWARPTPSGARSGLTSIGLNPWPSHSRFVWYMYMYTVLSNVSVPKHITRSTLLCVVLCCVV